MVKMLFAKRTVASGGKYSVRIQLYVTATQIIIQKSKKHFIKSFPLPVGYRFMK